MIDHEPLDTCSWQINAGFMRKVIHRQPIASRRPSWRTAHPGERTERCVGIEQRSVYPLGVGVGHAEGQQGKAQRGCTKSIQRTTTAAYLPTAEPRVSRALAGRKPQTDCLAGSRFIDRDVEGPDREGHPADECNLEPTPYLLEDPKIGDADRNQDQEKPYRKQQLAGFEWVSYASIARKAALTSAGISFLTLSR